MGAPGKWPYMFAYHAGDENNMGEDSVALILGKTNHKGCSGRLLAAGQSLSRSRLRGWDGFWLLIIDLSFLKSATCRRRRENNSVLVPPCPSSRCVWLMPPHHTRRKRLCSCASLFSAHLHPCSSCFILMVKGRGKKVARDRKEDAE